jgi:hypothetical protein
MMALWYASRASAGLFIFTSNFARAACTRARNWRECRASLRLGERSVHLPAVRKNFRARDVIHRGSQWNLKVATIDEDAIIDYRNRLWVLELVIGIEPSRNS